MSAQHALEDELKRALSDDTKIASAFGTPLRFVTGSEDRAAYPFIRVLRHETRPDAPNADGLLDHRISLEIFSRSGGREEAMRLIGLIADGLRAAELSPSGHQLILFHPVFSDVFLRPDGTTFRGLLRFRALSEPASLV